MGGVTIPAVGVLTATLLAGCGSGVEPGSPGSVRDDLPGKESGERAIPARLFATASRLVAVSVSLRLARAYEPDLAVFADVSLATREAGGETIHEGRGRCRVLVRALTIDCREFTVMIAGDDSGDPAEFRLLAEGDVEFTSGSATNRAETLIADMGGIVLVGGDSGDVEHRIELP